MVKLILMAGQSNMVGAGVTAELPQGLRSCPDGVRLWEDSTFRDFAAGEQFGPEVGFGHTAARWCEEEFVLCKVARGGANIYYDWNPDRREGGPEDEYRGPLYPALMEVAEEVRKRLRSEGRTPRVAGFLWMQGERDSVFDFMAEAYRANLEAFIGRLRADLDSPGLPFVIGKIAPRVLGGVGGGFVHAHRRIVRRAQEEVAGAVRGVRRVETDDLPQNDNLHFDTAGQFELGARFAQAWRELL